MTESPASRTISAMPDVQGDFDQRRVAIDKVGIRGLSHPLRFVDRSNRAQQSVAVSNAYVQLPHRQRGTHMSRLIAILNGRAETLSVVQFRDRVAKVAADLEAAVAFVETRFPFFLARVAPVSGSRSLLDCEVELSGRIENGSYRQHTRVIVPATSINPSSKSSALRGALGQRIHVGMTVESTPPLWIEELVELAGRHSSSTLYALLKRPDEKYVTEQAHDHPKFVEDVGRDIAIALGADPRMTSFRIDIDSLPSAHNHSGHASIESSTFRAL